MIKASLRKEVVQSNMSNGSDSNFNSTREVADS